MIWTASVSGEIVGAYGDVKGAMSSQTKNMAKTNL